MEMPPNPNEAAGRIGRISSRDNNAAKLNTTTKIIGLLVAARRGGGGRRNNGRYIAFGRYRNNALAKILSNDVVSSRSR
jgi:hypothetical protein